LATLLAPRSWLMLGIVAAYLLLVPLAIFNVVPTEPAVEATPTYAMVSQLLQTLEHMPYAERVRQYMEERGFPEPQIAAKTYFLATSYLIMLTAYLAALSIMTLVLLVWGSRTDFFSELLSMFGRRTGRIYGVLLSILLAIDAFVTWDGIDGLFPFPGHSFRGEDHIATSNLSVVTVVFFMGFSLLVTTAIVRLSLCAVYAWRYAPDAEPELPMKSIPPQDPTPEIETWQPDKLSH
jgi:hypothetical protein